MRWRILCGVLILLSGLAACREGPSELKPDETQPRFWIEVDRDAIAVGESITYTCQYDGSVPGPILCQWDFGDGTERVTSSIGENRHHTYNLPGRMTITLIAQHGGPTGFDRATREILVRERQ